jgi:hypothetical protein
VLHRRSSGTATAAPPGHNREVHQYLGRDMDPEIKRGETWRDRSLVYESCRSTSSRSGSLSPVAIEETKGFAQLFLREREREREESVEELLVRGRGSAGSGAL